ncbi:hypothetical protein [Williamsia sp. CHRR-6]|uniref:hypothetical protein n=1 Tax=Williamsia sp. CHRR-6 TaxID=2835871 RepID=UPI001BDA6964|nr:hypothetical protein [Williamsia sp. CHRR-6]MBT0567347.1 hypothetical protein [Williamsia sp. CHRR-6]
MSAQRCLSIFLDELLIADGCLRPPSVGEVIELPLALRNNAITDFPATDHHGRLEPDPDVRVGIDGPEWTGLLTGDGWSARWSGPRPMIGDVTVSGVLTCFHGDGSGRVRGRITRMHMVRQSMLGVPGAPPFPVRWGLDGRPYLAEETNSAPRHFDRSVIHDRQPELGETTTIGIGLILDLDLDVAPPPDRPPFVPGDISAHGSTLWQVDCALPIVRADDAEYLLPGLIGVDRSVFATASGCWVTGSDGLFRCAPGQSPVRVNDRAVGAAATLGELILTITTDGRWRIHSQDSSELRIPAPPGHCYNVAGRNDHWIAVVNDVASSEFKLVRIDLDANVTVGPVHHGVPGSWPALGGDPLNVRIDNQVHRIRGDLTLDPATRLRGRFIHGETRQVPDFTLDHLMWTVDCQTSRDELVLIHPETHELVRRIPLHGSAPRAAITDDGTIHLLDKDLRSVPPAA